MDYIQIQKPFEYYLESKLSKQNGSLLLQLKVPQIKTNKVLEYEAQINSSTQVAQFFGGVEALDKYLTNNQNIVIQRQETEEEISVLIKTNPNSSFKDKNIQRHLHKIKLKKQKIIDLNQKQKAMKQEERSSFQQILSICQNQEQKISDKELKKIIFELVEKIKQNTNDIQVNIKPKIIQQYQTLNRIISKQMLISVQQQSIQDKFGQLKEQLQNLYLILNIQIKQKINSMQDEMTSHQVQFKERLKQFKQLIFRQKRFRQQLQQQIQQKKMHQNRLFQTMKRQIIRLQKQVNLVNIKTSFPPVQMGYSLTTHNQISSLQYQFKFSSVLKNQRIRLLDDYSIMGTDDSRGKIALIEPSIKSWMNNMFQQNPTITLKVTKFSSNILFGVCDIEEVKAMRYKVNSWSASKHGGYYMNCGSYVYSSYKVQDNNQMKGFNFHDGQAIKITCQTKKKRIRFRNDNEQFCISYKPDVDLKRLYFAVIVHKDQSIVQIVQ